LNDNKDRIFQTRVPGSELHSCLEKDSKGMGEHQVSREQESHRLMAFVKALLGDLQALEGMLDANLFETGVRRIGAEQEMFLVDHGMCPAPIAVEVLNLVQEPRLTTEIARFNLEANATPRVFGPRCLREMEAEITELVNVARAGAKAFGGDVLLTGILPTLRLSDLGLDNMTPQTRYLELNDSLSRLRGGAFHVYIKGLDEMQLTHDNIMLESCNTSFQIHLQVWPSEFARLYNLAQAVTAPLMAAAVNSPLLLGNRLWHETRVALFQHSVDERSDTRQIRRHPSRVSFGESWVSQSVLEVFREDIARFRVILTADPIEDAPAMLAAGRIPKLPALRVHNGTVWRWNRPCYGVGNGLPQLRIENRVLPAGPTILDEVANAAFFYGMMEALADEYGDIARVMSFDDAKANFFAAARFGLKAQFTWVGNHVYTAAALILDHLLPLARRALKNVGVEIEDIDRYLGTIEERVRSDQTGAQWALRSLARMNGRGTPETRQRALSRAMLAHQQSGEPVHSWELAELRANDDLQDNYRIVGQFMTTDLFTVRPDDLVDLAASLMDWRHVRHVPVEDDEGRLVGVLSHRDLLRVFARAFATRDLEPVPVRQIMKCSPISVAPDTSTLEAMEIMQRNRIGCLPVVEGERLVGIVTAHDFLAVSAQLLETRLKGIGSQPIAESAASASTSPGQE
jgi:CBS domain-containing protein